MSTFSDNMRKWAEKSKKGIDQVNRAAILQLSNSVIKRTPVGNPALWQSSAPAGYIGGTARGNWFASVGAPITQPNLSSISGQGGDQNVQSKLSAAITEATGDVFYLTNNVPYIFRLEYQGWSSQAPTGMVRVSVTEFQQALTKAVAEL